MIEISTRAVLIRLGQRLKAKDADGGCPADEAVNWECDTYIERKDFWVDSRLTPKNPEDSVWFTQTIITPQKKDVESSGSAAQAATPHSVQPGLGMYLHTRGTNVFPGDEVLITVTGYIKIKDQPFNQYCFEKTIVAE